MVSWIPIAEHNVAWFMERRSTYVNRDDGRVSNHIPDVVHLPYGRRRRGRQHHLARHPRLFSTQLPSSRFLSQYTPRIRPIRIAGIQSKKLQCIALPPFSAENFSDLLIGKYQRFDPTARKRSRRHTDHGTRTSSHFQHHLEITSQMNYHDFVMQSHGLLIFASPLVKLRYARHSLPRERPTERTGKLISVTDFAER